MGLGWFSVALGLGELAAARAIARVLGLQHRTGLIRLFGVRELVSGLGLLGGGRARPWLWARVGGDVLDLALLSSALDPRNTRRDRAAVALASVAGVTALDVVAGARGA